MKIGIIFLVLTVLMFCMNFVESVPHSGIWTTSSMILLWASLWFMLDSNHKKTTIIDWNNNDKD